MLDAIGSPTGSQRIERQAGVERVARSAPAPAAGVYDIPSAPPADLLSELDHAAGVIDDLAARNVNLHFELDDRAGKVRVQLVDGERALLREIPATRLLDLLAGGSMTGLAVDAMG